MSDEPQQTMKVAAIGDLHVREDNAESYRELFGEISRQADVLVLAGDLTDLGKPREAELLAQDLKACSIPIVGVLGNHDYECGAHEEVAHIPAMKQFVNETMNETLRLENAMRHVRAKRSMVILHYAPIVETIESEPLEIYPFLGSSRLAETIDRFKVNAIVHGHAHRGRFEGRTPGGQPVYNVAKHIEKPTGKPYAIIEV